MQVRKYRSGDLLQILSLFYDAVHTVDASDYTPEQLDAWAPKEADPAEWDGSLSSNFAVVAVENGEVVGFGDIGGTGYLDRLYVHAGHIGQGIGTAICECLEGAVGGDILTHASLTAKPFFEKRGYVAVRMQQVERRGVLLTNCIMKKVR